MSRHILTAASFILGSHLLSFPTSACTSSWTYNLVSRAASALYASEEWRLQMYWNSVGAVFFILALMCSPPRSSRLAPRSSPDSIGVLRPGADFSAEKNGSIYLDEVERVPVLQSPFNTRFA